MAASIADTADAGLLGDLADSTAGTGGHGPGSPRFASTLRRRHAAEQRLILAGELAIGLAVAMLLVLLTSIVGRGYSAFVQTEVTLDLDLSAASIDPTGTRDPDTLRHANYAGIIRESLYRIFPDVTERRERRALSGLISSAAQFELAQDIIAHPQWIGTTRRIALPAADDIDQYIKGKIDVSAPESDRRIKDAMIGWVQTLKRQGMIGLTVNTRLFTTADSRNPEMAGILGALVGSLLTLCICLLVSFPLGVAAAIYLEEFAPRNRWTDLIEVNINNLAAVPSIIFGLLGLAVFLNTFNLPRSAPLVGGLVLALMTLPTIIIAGRAALKAVPPSIREAALGLGASHHQVVSHHVLPLALPGMLTGTIIGMAQALGETAPLLMIGMVAFIADVPAGFTDPATVLPVQIYLWADSPERAFTERTSAAIMVLLAFLILMNAGAVWLRRKLERRW